MLWEHLIPVTSCTCLCHRAHCILCSNCLLPRLPVQPSMNFLTTGTESHSCLCPSAWHRVGCLMSSSFAWMVISMGKWLCRQRLRVWSIEDQAKRKAAPRKECPRNLSGSGGENQVNRQRKQEIPRLREHQYKIQLICFGQNRCSCSRDEGQRAF